MSNLLKVEGHDSLVRDVTSGAIINKSEAEYTKYIKQKEAFQLRRAEMQRQAEEINNLKNDLSEIKSLLQKILEK